jgi:hypothetical protein
MSIYYSTPARNILVPELLPDTSRLTPAELASYAAGGRALHAAGIHPKRRDFTSWQSAEPPSWNSNSPTDSDAAAVGLDSALGLGFYIYVIPDAVGLLDLVPEGTPALDDNYLTDGADRWVVLAHGLDVSEDLKNAGGVSDDPILTSFQIAVGDVVTAPTVGCSFVGEGSSSRWLSRHSDAEAWQVLEAKPSAAALIAGWDPSEALLDYFDVSPDGAKLKAKHDRIASVRFRRADLGENWQDALWNLPVEAGGPLVMVSPSFVMIFLELSKAVIGSKFGVRLVDLPEGLRLAGGKAPSLTVSRGSGQRVHMDPVPGSAGCYLLGGVGRPLRLLDRGTDQKGVLLAGWPPAPLPTPIS